MDAIDTIDWGAYAHFTFVAAKYPDVIQRAKSFYQTANYHATAGLLAGMFVLSIIFVLQYRLRAALMTWLGLFAAFGMIEVCRFLVPRRRPPDAQELVGLENMLGSYPSDTVFLFMLLMIYAGFALWPWLRARAWQSAFIAVAAALTVSVAMSQFFLAIHFVSDVVGGIVGATIVGFVVSRFLDPVKAPSPGEPLTVNETGIRAGDPV